jgi:hypothetical protein
MGWYLSNYPQLSIPIKINMEMPYPLACNFGRHNLLFLHTRFLYVVRLLQITEGTDDGATLLLDAG